MNRRWIALLCLTAQVTAASAPALAEPGAGSGPARIPREAPGVVEAASSREPPGLSRTSNRRRWGLAVSAAGLAAGVGLAAWLKSEADDRYDLYLSTADPARAREHFDAAERYDRATLLGWVMAQASFVGLMYFLIHEEERPLVPARGEPLVRAAADGLEVGVVLWP